jgi:uncharacterized protein YdhG (YjbR/CyaY superfamily)
MARRTYTSIDDYIAAAAPAARPVLRKIRAIVGRTAPDAEETISYGIPAFRQSGILIYFAAFTAHIGVFPPVQGDAALMRAVSRYAGEKGNLRLPLDQPIPYALIERVVKARMRQQAATSTAKKKKKKKKTAARRSSARPTRQAIASRSRTPSR